MLCEGDSYQSDLEYLVEHSVHKDIATLIHAFIVQVDESNDAKWCLTQWKGENDNPFFNVRAINTLQSQGFNIYRVRPLGSRLSRYRILYAYDSEYDDFYLLAVVEKPPENEVGTVTHDRVYNYEHDHAITKRICEEYDATGIPRIRVH